MQGRGRARSTDDALLAAIADGELDALTELMVRHGPHVRRSLHLDHQWHSVLDPDDVMQVTYIEAFLQIRQFEPRGPGSFRAWLRRIAQDNLRDAIRGLQRNKRPPPGKRVRPPLEEDSYVGLCELLGVASTTPSRAAMQAEARSLLESAIRELPPDYASVVRLYDLECKTGPEVAAAMGRSRGAIYLLRMRAHDRLRKKLGSSTEFLSG